MAYVDLERQLLIELEVKNILTTHFSDVYFSGSSYNFRCNVCGDSKYSKLKKRGHIYTNSTPWMYHCFNCNVSMPVEFWLQTHFPFEYNAMCKELTKSKMSNGCDVDHLRKKINKIKIKKLEKKFDEKKDISFFKNIKKYPHLVDYCKKRLISESIYSKWYYADGGFYKNRLIIPFYDNNNKIYYFQGRDLNKNSDCKYLSRMGEKLNSIYNYYNVDKSKPVIILEGPIDSSFIINSIGMTGLKDKTKLLEAFPFKYYLLDNDKSGRDKSLSLLQNGNYVFNWKLFLKDYPCTRDIKDVNDFIKYNANNIRELTFEFLKKYFTNNVNFKVFFI